MIVYDPSCSQQVKQWIQDAVAKMTFDVAGRFGGTITFMLVTEPSTPGHQDMMCTTYTAPNAVVQIRRGFDSPDSPFQKAVPGYPETVKAWFVEGVVHELSHCWAYSQLTSTGTQAAMCALFRRGGLAGNRAGTLADYDSTSLPWQDRIIEAVAEVMKDAVLPAAFRVYDNRTNWAVAAADYTAFANTLRLGGVVAHTQSRSFLTPTRTGLSAEFFNSYGNYTAQLKAFVYDITNLNLGLIRAGQSDPTERERLEILRVVHEYEQTTPTLINNVGGEIDLVYYTDATQPLINTPFVAANVDVGWGNPDTLEIWLYTANPRLVNGNLVKDYAEVKMAQALDYVSTAAVITTVGTKFTTTASINSIGVATRLPTFLVLTVAINATAARLAAAQAFVSSITPVVEYIIPAYSEDLGATLPYPYIDPSISAASGPRAALRVG